MPSDSVEAIVSEGCMFFKEEKYEEAKNKFMEALNMSGYQMRYCLQHCLMLL